MDLLEEPPFSNNTLREAMEHTVEENNEQTLISALPPEVIEKFLYHVDAHTLAVSIPRVSKQFKDFSTDNGALWQSKRQDLNIIDFREDITFKKQFLDNTGHLFPIYGYTIGRVRFQELLNDPRATPATIRNPLVSKPHVLAIEGMEFCCTDMMWSYVEFERGISDPPAKWKAMGFDLEGSYNDYCLFFLLRHSNVKIWHSRVLLGVLNARISTIVKEGDLYYEIFVDIRVEGAIEMDNRKAVLQKGAARAMQVHYSKDLDREYPQRIADSAEELLKIRQQLVQERQRIEKKRMWTKILSNLRSDDVTLIKNTLSDLNRMILHPSAATHPQIKSKELLSAIHKFIGHHENPELEVLAGQYFISFIKIFPKDAGLILETGQNLVLARRIDKSTNK